MEAIAESTMHYECYKESGVEWLGEIPEHWEVKPGFTVLSESKEKNIGFIEKTVLSLSYGKVVIKPEEKLTGLVPESFETYQLVEPGDIIIRPTDLQNDKTSLRTGLAKNNGIITSAYINLRVKGNYSSSFYHYYLHTIDINKIIYGLGSGLRQNISFWDFKRFPFPLPPLKEQTAIAQFLDDKTAKIDQAIAIKEQQISLLKERKQILIHKSVTRGLDDTVALKDSGVDWIGEIPEYWEVKKLKFLFDKIQTGTTPSTSNQSFYDGNINWYNPKDLNNEVLVEAERKLSKLAIQKREVKTFPKDSVLIVGIGATAGKTSYLLNEGTFNQQITGFHSNSELNKYFFYLLRSLSNLMLNTANYTTLVILNNEFFKILNLVQPPLSEQKQISDYIESASQKIETAIGLKEQEIEKLKEYKGSLINGVVTGKVRVY